MLEPKLEQNVPETRTPGLSRSGPLPQPNAPPRDPAPPARAGWWGGKRGCGHAHSLEVVRLQEFAVVQQVGQMGHEPPVAQGNAAGADGEARTVRVRRHGPQGWGMSTNPTRPLLRTNEGTRRTGGQC